jgi:hypothetical protein
MAPHTRTRKRPQRALIIDELQRQLDQHRADLTHIDGVLRVLATDLDPETIRLKRVYRRNRVLRPERTLASLPWRASNRSGRVAEHG